MITAKEAREKVENLTDVDYFWNSITSSIYDGIGAGLLHCVWYTPVRYDCVENDMNIIRELVGKLKALGYSCTLTIFTPNKKFVNTRVKLHINWE